MRLRTRRTSRVSKARWHGLMPCSAFCRLPMSRLPLQAGAAVAVGVMAHGVVVVESAFQAPEPAGPEAGELASRAAEAAVVLGVAVAPAAMAWVIPLTARALPRSPRIPEATPCGLRKPP